MLQAPYNRITYNSLASFLTSPDPVGDTFIRACVQLLAVRIQAVMIDKTCTVHKWAHTDNSANSNVHSLCTYIRTVRMYDVLLYDSTLPMEDMMSPLPTAEHTATPSGGTRYTSTETDTSTTRLSKSET